MPQPVGFARPRVNRDHVLLIVNPGSEQRKLTGVCAQVGFQVRALPVNLVASQVMTTVLLFPGAAGDLALTRGDPRRTRHAGEVCRCRGGGVAVAERNTPRLFRRIAIC